MPVCDAPLCFKQTSTASSTRCANHTGHIFSSDALIAAPTAYVDDGRKGVLFGPVQFLPVSDDPLLKFTYNVNSDGPPFVGASFARSLYDGEPPVRSRPFTPVLQTKTSFTPHRHMESSPALGVLLLQEHFDLLKARKMARSEEVFIRSSADTCPVCQKKANRLLRCTKCLYAEYCSSDCQMAAWAEHRHACKRLSRQRAAPCYANGLVGSLEPAIRKLLQEFAEIYKPMLIWLALQPFLQEPERDFAQAAVPQIQQHQNYVFAFNMKLAANSRASTPAIDAFEFDYSLRQQIPQFLSTWNDDCVEHLTSMSQACSLSVENGGAPFCVGVAIRLSADCCYFFPVPYVGPDGTALEAEKALFKSSSGHQGHSFECSQKLVKDWVSKGIGMDAVEDAELRDSMVQRLDVHKKLTAGL